MPNPGFKATEPRDTEPIRMPDQNVEGHTEPQCQEGHNAPIRDTLLRRNVRCADPPTFVLRPRLCACCRQIAACMVRETEPSDQIFEQTRVTRKAISARHARSAERCVGAVGRIRREDENKKF